MKLILGAAVLITALGISTVNANPMGNCGPLDKAMEYLNRKHGETLKFTGISSEGHMIMMFYNEETGSFGFGFVFPDNPNLICPVDQGESGTFYSEPSGSKT